MTSLLLLAVLDVLSSTPARAKQRAPRPDGPLTHFTSPRGEKGRLDSDVVLGMTFQKSDYVLDHANIEQLHAF